MMWAEYTILSYLVLALAIPAGWPLARVWLRTRGERRLRCPETGTDASVRLDAAYAVRMHAIGNPELRVLACSRWPEHAGCGRACAAAG